MYVEGEYQLFWVKVFELVFYFFWGFYCGGVDYYVGDVGFKQGCDICFGLYVVVDLYWDVNFGDQ